MHDTDLTKRQVILLAAADLAEPFTANDLVKAAWEKDPKSFSLLPYPLPDSNAVLWNLMGERGMVKQGYLELVAEKTYRMTETGRREVTRLRTNGPIRRALPRVQPSRDCEARLTRAMLSRAIIRFRSGQLNTINLTDALDFWGARPGDRAHVVEGLRDVLARYVREAREATVREVCRLRSGQEVTERELADLVRVDAWLWRQFGRQFEKRKGVMAV